MESKVKIKGYVAISAAILAISFAFGLFEALLDMAGASAVIEDFFSSFEFVQNLGSFGVFLFILINNSIKAFLIIFTGILFGAVPLFFLAANGQIMGMFFVVFSTQIGFWPVFLGILPHGVIEIPAIILSSAYGFWLGGAFYRKIRYSEPMREKINYAFFRYIKIILPSLLAAAAIETYITPNVISILFG